MLALALTSVAAHAERADRTKPMHLEADHVSIDDAKKISTFEGNIQFTQGTILLRSNRMVVTQDKEGNMHGTAYGNPAYFRQKREGMDEYIEGYGQRLEYDTRTETIDIYDQARILQVQDEVRGQHITYNLRTEVFQVHGAPPGSDAASGDKGRVHVVIQPKNKPKENEGLPIKPEDTLTLPPQPPRSKPGTAP